MSNFYTLLTNIGAALHANAQVQQTTVAWSHFALGDGNGAAVVPTQTQTGLRREVHRLAITSIETHPDNPNWIVVEAVVPSDVGGWTVRESAIYGGPGGNTCIAVGNYPETYKPVLAEGAGREMVMRMIVEISSVATVKLQIDPAVAIASRQWVQSLVASPQKAGLVKLATVDESKEGVRDDVAVTPEGLDAALEGLNGLPIFLTGHHDGDRASLIRVFNGMATPDDGDQLSALTHPGVVEGVLRGDVKSCTEEEWQTDPYKRGMWSKGNAYLDAQGKPQGWVRMSDRNGVKEGSLPAPFWRGGTDAKVGSIGNDTMRRLEGKVGAIGYNYRESVIDLEGVFELGTPAAAIATNGAGGQAGHTGFKFDSAKGLPAGHTGTEFAPWNITGVSYTITANGIVNESELDAAGVMAQVLAVQTRVSALEDIPKPIGYKQVWTNMLASRSLGTIFTNNKPRTRSVSITALSSSAAGTMGASLRVYVEGEELCNGTFCYGPNAPTSVYFTVGPWKEYRVVIGSGAGVLFSWKEELEL